MQACALQDTGKSEILLPYICIVLDSEKGALLLTSALNLAKEHDETVERSEYLFTTVLV